jgi:phage FluMu protein Com
MQAWLLAQGKCVGCGKLLVKKQGKGFVRITCSCGRIYMYDPVENKYRRATLDEVK